jgi:hypothetical protein
METHTDKGEEKQQIVCEVWRVRNYIGFLFRNYQKGNGSKIFEVVNKN